MVKKLLLLPLLFVVLISVANAQYSNDSPEKAEFYKLRESLEGHYQLQVIGRGSPVMSYDLLKKIESIRKFDEEVLIEYSQNLKVLVLPKNSDKRFIKGKDDVIYIE
jgi:hypothetical protein